jgi:hypothetical protein
LGMQANQGNTQFDFRNQGIQQRNETALVLSITFSYPGLNF